LVQAQRFGIDFFEDVIEFFLEKIEPICGAQPCFCFSRGVVETIRVHESRHKPGFFLLVFS
jgi:hypothetical protein